MKKVTLAATAIVAIVGMGTMIGCGGSGNSNTSNDTGGAQGSALDTRSIETIGTNVANLVPGCVFTGNSVSSVMQTRTLEGYEILYKSISTTQKGKRSRGVAVDTEPVQGTCGGTMQQSGNDSNMHYTFNNYCTGGGDIQTTINGTLDLTITMSGSGDNQELSYAKITTGSNGLTTTTIENGQSSTESFYLDDLEYRAGTPNKLTLKELKIVSSADGTYRLTNVSINQYGDPETGGTVEVQSATYYDPDIGAVTLSTSKLPMAEDATGSGWFKLTRGGESALFTTDDLSSGKFTVEQNGKTLGALDCSATLTQIK